MGRTMGHLSTRRMEGHGGCGCCLWRQLKRTGQGGLGSDRGEGHSPDRLLPSQEGVGTRTWPTPDAHPGFTHTNGTQPLEAGLNSHCCLETC